MATVDGHNGPVFTNPTVSELEHPSPASQDENSEDMDFSSTPRKSRLSAPQLQAQLSRFSDRTRLRSLKNTLHSEGCVAASGENRRLCHAHVSQMALPLRRVCGECPDAARLHHQRAEKTRKQGVDRIRRVPIVWFSLKPNLNTEKRAASPKPLGDTTHAFAPSWVD